MSREQHGWTRAAESRFGSDDGLSEGEDGSDVDDDDDDDDEGSDGGKDMRRAAHVLQDFILTNSSGVWRTCCWLKMLRFDNVSL